jgi:hypothetical protein
MTQLSVTSYPALAGDVDLTIRHAEIDGSPLHLSLISAKERVVALHQVERRSWDTARLSVQATLPEDELERRTDSWSHVRCHVLVAERASNTRLMTPLTQGPTGIWSAAVELHMDRHVARANIEAVVTATVDGEPGRVIGTSDPWTADLVARTPSRQRSVTVLWRDFNADPDAALYSYRNDPWSLDTTGPEPILYLNEGLEGLRRLLSGSDRVARESLLAQIAMNTWSALFNTAISSLEGAEWPGDWQESVLRRLLPEMFPDRSPEDALAEVFERRAGGDEGDLHMRLAHSATHHARIPRTLSALLRAADIHSAAEGEAQ